MQLLIIDDMDGILTILLFLLFQMVTKEMFEEGLKDLVENEVCIVTNKIIRMLL